MNCENSRVTLKTKHYTQHWQLLLAKAMITLKGNNISGCEIKFNPDTSYTALENHASIL